MSGWPCEWHCTQTLTPSTAFEPRRVDDVRPRRVVDVVAARAVARLAADVPLGRLLRSQVVVDRMAAVTERAGRPGVVAAGIELRPPVGAVRDLIRAPLLVRDVPLRAERKVVVADLREVALLPLAAVDPRDLIFRERQQRIGLGQVWNDRVGMLLRIADDVGHPRILPAVVDGRDGKRGTAAEPTYGFCAWAYASSRR